MMIDYYKFFKSLTDILDNIHKFYSEEKEISDDELKKIYKPVLECPILKNKIVWFNAWSEESDGRISLYFLKNPPDAATKNILDMVSYPEVSEFVTSVRDLYDKLGRKDLSYIISNCDDSEVNELVELPALYFHVKFRQMALVAFDKTNFNELHARLNTAFQNNGDNGLNKTIEILKKSYKKIKDIEDIGSHLGSLSNLIKSDTEKAKIINYFAWIKLAYPQDWKILLALSGLVAKDVKSVPVGVNIGLTEVIPLDVINWLKIAVSLFFTRESVEFFERKAKKEAYKRIKQEREISHLLYEFPHIVGNYVSRDIEKALEFGDTNTVKELAKFMKEIGTYMSSTLKAKEPSKIKYKLKECIERFKSTPLRLTVDTTINEDKYWTQLSKWEAMFEKIDIEDSLIISLPEGVLEIIFSNLLSNTMKMADKHEPKVFISAKKENDECVITYQEYNGIGFDPKTVKNIKRWATEGPSEKEGTKGFGYRSIYKAAKEISKGKFKIIINYNNREIDILDDNTLEDFRVGKLHPIHKFIFDIYSAFSDKDVQDAANAFD